MLAPAAGWSLERLAEISGLADRTIIDFERGLRQPLGGTLIALRKALKTIGPVLGSMCF